MTLIQPTLTTARLVLRPFVAADAPAIEALAGLREVADTTLNIPHPYPAGAAAEWIASRAAALAAGEGMSFAIEAAGALVGSIGINLTPAHASAELGYWVAPAEWGRGYATEAARAVCDLAFGALALNRVQAHHFLRNPASGRVMQKLGMTREGVLRDAVRKWGVFEDLALYAVLAREWRG